MGRALCRHAPPPARSAAQRTAARRLTRPSSCCCSCAASRLELPTSRPVPVVCFWISRSLRACLAAFSAAGARGGGSGSIHVRPHWGSARWGASLQHRDALLGRLPLAGARPCSRRSLRVPRLCRPSRPTHQGCRHSARAAAAWRRAGNCHSAPGWPPPPAPCSASAPALRCPCTALCSGSCTHMGAEARGRGSTAAVRRGRAAALVRPSPTPPSSRAAQPGQQRRSGALTAGFLAPCQRAGTSRPHPAACTWPAGCGSSCGGRGGGRDPAPVSASTGFRLQRTALAGGRARLQAARARRGGGQRGRRSRNGRSTVRTTTRRAAAPTPLVAAHRRPQTSPLAGRRALGAHSGLGWLLRPAGGGGKGSSARIQTPVSVGRVGCGAVRCRRCAAGAAAGWNRPRGTHVRRWHGAGGRGGHARRWRLP